MTYEQAEKLAQFVTLAITDDNGMIPRELVAEGFSRYTHAYPVPVKGKKGEYVVEVGGD